MASKIFLIRHGETEANKSGCFVGVCDPPLSDHGIKQAEGLVAFINRVKPGRVLSSPLQRAMETAKIATGQAAMDIDKNLMEADFGEWDGLTFDEVSRKHPELAQRWFDGDVDFTFPGGDSVTGFITRVERAMNRLIEDEADVVAAFTHGGVIGQAICRLLDLPYTRHVVFRLPTASVTTVEMFEGRGVLTGICNTNFEKGVQ